GQLSIDHQTTATKETHMSVPTEDLAGATAIRPFRVDIPEEALDDLRRRIAATRWPSKELVADRTQGVQLATIQELARYWAEDYDFGRIEAKLNALPQFTTEIDGVEIHFIHVRSKHEDAMPLIMTHGWPGSVIEARDDSGGCEIHLLHVRSKHEDPMPLIMTHGWPGSVIELLETIGPLTDPTAHGGRAEDAFHLVLPSLHGYGFSGEPAELGWNVGRVAQAWAELMHRLGYSRQVRPGRDPGAA